jgi:2'-5' RNA ligase/phage head maturation protease
VEDDVGDVILPGAFTKTLRRRPTKPVWSHDWKEPIGVCRTVEEWMPGDPRLPKSTPTGEPWPAAAGALASLVVFNLKTKKGSDAYEQVKQWHEEGGGAQWSIGYTVPKSGATKRSGVRFIHELDLYEVSPVLHGAHPLTMSLQVKSGQPGIEGMEYKATPASTGDENPGAMIALYPAPDVAQQVAHPDGDDPDELHITLAYLGKTSDLPDSPEALAALLGRDAAPVPELSGQLGGIGHFPDKGDGTPCWVPVDVPGLEDLRQHVTTTLASTAFGDTVNREHGYVPHMTLGFGLPHDTPAVPPTPVSFDRMWVVSGSNRIPVPFAGHPDSPPSPVIPEAKTAAQAVLEAKEASAGWKANEGNAENLRKWYVHGGGAAQIAWGTPGDFDRCVAIAGKHMTPENAKGYCDLRHKEATGIWPATHAKLDRGGATKTAQQAVAHARTLPTRQPLEMKELDTTMPGSYEEQRRALTDALRTLLLPQMSSDGDLDDTPGMAQPDYRGWVCLEATYPDHCIATVEGAGNDGSQTYSVPYSFDGDDPVLGSPQRVTVTLVAAPDDDDDGPDDDDDESEAPEDEPDNARYILPAATGLADANSALQASDAPPEALAALRPHIEKLLATMAKKGAPVVTADLGNDDSADDNDDGDDGTEDGWDWDNTSNDDWSDDAMPGSGSNSSAPPASGKASPTDPDGDGDDDSNPDGDPDDDGQGDDGTDNGDGTVSLDPATVHAQLAALNPSS